MTNTQLLDLVDRFGDAKRAIGAAPSDTAAIPHMAEAGRLFRAIRAGLPKDDPWERPAVRTSAGDRAALAILRRKDGAR